MADVDDLLDRLVRGVVQGASEGVPLPMRLCLTAVSILGGTGGAITLAYTHLERVTLCATDSTARTLEEAQDVLAQGPAPEAYTTGSYTRLDVDSDLTPDPRWPILLTSGVTSLGPLVLHAIPLGSGADSVGVLSVYQSGLEVQLDVAAATVLGLAVGAALLADAPTRSDAGQGEWDERAQVHQATGMVVAQLGIGPADSVALLRAHAYAHDRTLTDVAADVIDRRLVFTSTPGQEITSS